MRMQTISSYPAGATAGVMIFNRYNVYILLIYLIFLFTKI